MVDMLIAAAEIRLFAPWVHSLKEKRMEVKSLISRIQNKFHLSAAEIAEQDTHQVIVLGVAGIAADAAQADSILEHVVRFVEESTDAEITAVITEHR